MKKFNETQKQYFDKLNLFVPVVDRVHGGNHPEFHEVRRVFDEINTKVKIMSTKKPDLVNEFKQLREITNNYVVPNDVCESFEAVYHMLAEIDQAYEANTLM